MKNVDISHLSPDQRLALEDIDRRLSTRLDGLHRWAVLEIHAWIMSATAITRAGIRAAPSLHRSGGHGSLGATIVNSRSGVISHQCGLVFKTHDKRDVNRPIETNYSPEDLCFTAEQFTWLCIPDTINPWIPSSSPSQKVRHSEARSLSLYSTDKFQRRHATALEQSGAGLKSSQLRAAHFHRRSIPGFRAHRIEQLSRSRRGLGHEKTRSLPATEVPYDQPVAPQRRSSVPQVTAGERSGLPWYLQQDYTCAYPSGSAAACDTTTADIDITLGPLSDFLTDLKPEEPSKFHPLSTNDFVDMELDTYPGATHPDFTLADSLSSCAMLKLNSDLEMPAPLPVRPEGQYVGMTTEDRLPIWCPSIFGASDAASASGESLMSVRDIEALFDEDDSSTGAEDHEMLL